MAEAIDFPGTNKTFRQGDRLRSMTTDETADALKRAAR